MECGAPAPLLRSKHYDESTYVRGLYGVRRLGAAFTVLASRQPDPQLRSCTGAAPLRPKSAPNSSTCHYSGFPSLVRTSRITQRVIINKICHPVPAIASQIAGVVSQDICYSL